METQFNPTPSQKGLWAASVDLQDAYLHIPIHPRHQRYLAFQYAGRSLHSGHSRSACLRHQESSQEWQNANTNTDDPVPGGQTRLHHRHSQSLRTKDRGSQSGHSPDHIVTRVTHRNVAPSPGANVQPGRRGDIMQTTHASAATPPAENGQPTNPGPDSADPPIGSIHPHLQWWHDTGNWDKGSLHHQFAKHIGHDGRLIDRVGSPLEELDSLGDVVHSRKVMAHQLTRDVGCQTGPRVVPRTPEKYSNHRLHGHTTVVAYINRQGGTHSERLCQLTWEVLMTAKDSGMTLRASHIAGKLNVMADALSRGQMDPNEWALSQKTCNRIFEIFGKPMVDLFATAENTKLQIFCSRQFHPRAHHIDAMSFPWNNLELTPSRRSA
ncbi:hypothetical protein BSL78_24356 [Apostichopus japonicus]|uniref:Uncharacterized protein n=1 Tax=Stichopus japonicus TaxID=307972 RepID=A0A2G8JSQ8_STIJA|nr:hypothetical protein BSL78_24356 [Apostichopus japonicus]